MHFFRVKIGQDANTVVEPFLEWQRLDGTAYIPVGGLSMSYISVSPDFEPTDKTGRVMVGGIQPNARGGLELVPQGVVRTTESGAKSFIPASEADDDRAFVVVPSGAFDFDIRHGQSPVSPRDRLAALSVVLHKGESIKAMPKVRTLREWDDVKPMYLTYHGSGRLTFSTDAPVAAVEETIRAVEEAIAS